MAITAEPVAFSPLQTAKGTLAQRVTRLLLAHFPQAEIQLYRKPLPKVSGTLLWNGFEGIEIATRHRMVWETLESYFTEEELEHDIVGFYANTFFEDSFMEQADPSAWITITDGTVAPVLG